MFRRLYFTKRCFCVPCSEFAYSALSWLDRNQSQLGCFVLVVVCVGEWYLFVVFVFVRRVNSLTRSLSRWFGRVEPLNRFYLFRFVFISLTFFLFVSIVSFLLLCVISCRSVCALLSVGHWVMVYWLRTVTWSVSRLTVRRARSGARQWLGDWREEIRTDLPRSLHLRALVSGVIIIIIIIIVAVEDGAHLQGQDGDDSPQLPESSRRS